MSGSRGGRIARSVCLLAPAIAAATAVFGLWSLGSTVADARGWTAHRIARRWARAILAVTGVRLTVRGTLPPDASVVIASNHQSFYDIPILFWTIPTQVRIIAKASLGRVPFIGWHLRRAGHLLVDRDHPGASIVKKMHRLISEGASLVIFPEGTRSRDGVVGRFKPGVFLLAIEAGLPIVPISIAGSRAVMPKGDWTAAPADVRVTVHPPVSTSGLTRDDARALADRVRAIVAADAA